MKKTTKPKKAVKKQAYKILKSAQRYDARAKRLLAEIMSFKTYKELEKQNNGLKDGSVVCGNSILK